MLDFAESRAFPRPLTLDEARSKVVEALKQQRAQQMVAMKASEVARKLRDELKSGKPVGGRPPPRRA